MSKQYYNTLYAVIFAVSSLSKASQTSLAELSLGDDITFHWYDIYIHVTLINSSSKQRM